MSSVNITSGPNKFDLMLSLFEGKRIKLIADGKSLIVRIASVAIEDGSNESWLIAGYIAQPKAEKPAPPKRPVHVSGYYSTKRRTGILTYSK